MRRTFSAVSVNPGSRSHLAAAHRRGQALVPVLLIVVILTAYVAIVSATARREMKAAGNFLRATQEHYIAKGAVEYVLAQLQQVTNGGSAVPVLTQPADTDANGWTALGDGYYKLDLIDTASRLNINTADLATIAALPQFANDLSIAPSIVDWRDADDTPTSWSTGSGVESEYYQSQTPPYNARNGPFDTVDELLLVQGFSPQLLYGVSGQIGAGSASGSPSPLSTRSSGTRQSGGTGSQATPFQIPESTIPLAEMLTTYSKEANYDSEGTKRVNVKTATAQQLIDLMVSAGVQQNQAQTLANRFTGTSSRQAGGGQGGGQGGGGGGQGGGGGGGQGGGGQQQQPSQQSQLTTLGDLLGKRNPGSATPLVDAWPRTVLQLVADKLTVSDEEFNTGMLNINTAPAEVLGTLSGMDDTLYSTLQSLREQGTEFATVNDLFQGETFTGDQLRVLFGKVCTKSSVYIVRVRVRMRGSPRTYVSQALVELAPPQPAEGSTSAAGGAGGAAVSGQTAQSTTPKLLQWREVPRTPGWSSWMPARSYYQ